ncbi:site-specific integrase [Burkholderia oklahomensis]|uniref:site-specific integrase n=1 Tax=Burkholderia oklahomensis TaxID=342113 RepID=UPI00016A90D1|nr:site-specific integrase [Burkholderia oklahomensis]AJX33777.1 phage integrase family protein [Burkholderia oklahomensis C6786]AOI44816.1 integrase [Burkholderia oklahomensis C6786]KUY65282.1 integrase [Burkholderia oklahomensis C6786]MBI0359161.1 site-specific integrase [Burkholderia oklahomensis]SUW57970.1 Site-specific recombinase XerD [Burkholderia oklahomensis]
MASIENRSRIQVTVQKHDDLTKSFARTADPAIQAYLQKLRDQGYKPKLTSLDDYYVIRSRSVGHKNQSFTARSEAEAIRIKNKLESEQAYDLFTDYASAKQHTLADLLIRYLHKEAPRHKSFEVEAYKINMLLEDAGLPRQDLAAIVAAHPNPHPKVRDMKFRKATGTRVSKPSETSRFIRKSFAAVIPDDFTDYIDERCQEVSPATVDREIDIFSAVCNIAIETWRIRVAKNPMDGVRRPRYYNERDRRLKGDEETRLLAAAREEDRRWSIEARLQELMSDVRIEAERAHTTYRRKLTIKEARKLHASEAEQSFKHVPQLETFINFQLMTGARRSETLTLTWANVDLDAQTAFLPETKNGRPRKLPLRLDLVEMLRNLPRNGKLVFPIGVDGLRKAWSRICKKAGLDGKEDGLRIHDLRHEAISRVAEAGSNTPGGFSLVDLQAFSGHRDTRMLLRYAHLCAQSLAKRLDAAFGDKPEDVAHRGIRRLKKGAGVTLQEVIAEGAAATLGQFDGDNTGGAQMEQPPRPAPAMPTSAIGNVVHIDFTRRVA